MKAKELLVSAGSLLLAGLILVVAGNAVAPAAAANAAAEQQEMMETLLPGSTVFTPEEDTGTDANITAVWKGEGGWIIETTVDGYAGPIRQWTGVDSNGHVTGLVVRDMEETFGLGRNALTDIDFLVQFVGHLRRGGGGRWCGRDHRAPPSPRGRLPVASVPPARMSPVQMSARLRQSGEVDAV